MMFVGKERGEQQLVVIGKVVAGGRGGEKKSLVNLPGKTEMTGQRTQTSGIFGGGD